MYGLLVVSVVALAAVVGGIRWAVQEWRARHPLGRVRD